MNIVDLFCGCGGLSLGFQNAGLNVVAAYDNWEAAIKVYAQNFNHPVNSLDLSDEDYASSHIRLYNHDMIIGGPP